MILWLAMTPFSRGMDDIERIEVAEFLKRVRPHDNLISTNLDFTIHLNLIKKNDPPK